MNQMNLLLAGGIIYCKKRVFGGRVSIQRKSKHGNPIMLVQPSQTLAKGADANHEPKNTGVRICQHVDDFSVSLLEHLNSSIHELEQKMNNQFSSLLNKMTMRIDEAQRMNDAKYSLKDDIKNLVVKIEKLDEKRIQAKY